MHLAENPECPYATLSMDTLSSVSVRHRYTAQHLPCKFGSKVPVGATDAIAFCYRSHSVGLDGP